MSFLLGSKVLSETLIESKKRSSQLSVELFAYDFVNLAIKLIVFSVIAVIIDKLHFVITGIPNVAGAILGAFGLNVPTSEPDFLAKLFSEEGFEGLHYWDIIKFALIILVAMEWINYMQSQKRLGGEASPITMAVFALITFALAIFTIPELLKKLRSRVTNQGVGV